MTGIDKNIDIMLAIFAKTTINCTFSECMNSYSHTMSFMLINSAYENYFKAKLFSLDPKIVFPEYESASKTGKSINFDKISQLLEEKFKYKVNNNFIEQVKKERNKLFHFAEYEINPKESLKILFEIIIPFLEKYYPDELEMYFEYLGNFDEAIFENYLIEQLKQHNIKYSKLIKNKFTND